MKSAVWMDVKKVVVWVGMKVLRKAVDWVVKSVVALAAVKVVLMDVGWAVHSVVALVVVMVGLWVDKTVVRWVFLALMGLNLVVQWAVLMASLFELLCCLVQKRKK